MRVNGACDVEECAGNTLHACDSAFIKFWCGCGVGRVLYLGPIRRRDPCWGRVLGACGRGVLEALQVFTDRVGYVDVDVISRVVPFDVQAVVLDSR